MAPTRDRPGARRVPIASRRGCSGGVQQKNSADLGSTFNAKPDRPNSGCCTPKQSTFPKIRCDISGRKPAPARQKKVFFCRVDLDPTRRHRQTPPIAILRSFQHTGKSPSCRWGLSPPPLELGVGREREERELAAAAGPAKGCGVDRRTKEQQRRWHVDRARGRSRTHDGGRGGGGGRTTGARQPAPHLPSRPLGKPCIRLLRSQRERRRSSTSSMRAKSS